MLDAVTIERAEPTDAAAILAIQRAAYASEAALYASPDIPPLRQTIEDLVGEFEICVILKAALGGEIVGSVRAREVDGTVHIGRLIVRPEMQRQGIGTALLRAIEASFPAARRFELFTGHLSHGNIALYSRLGYRESRREVVDERLTLVFLEKAAGA